MNKTILAQITRLANDLDEQGLFPYADALTKFAANVSVNDIIFPDQPRNKYSIIVEKFKDLISELDAIPAGKGSYVIDLKKTLKDQLSSAGSRISAMMVEDRMVREAEEFDSYLESL